MARPWAFVVTPSRVAEVRILARSCLVAGLVTWGLAVVPFSPTAPRGLLFLVGAVGVVLGAVLHRLAERTTALAVHAVVALATGLVGWCVAAAATLAGAQLTAAAFLWVGAYSAIVHTRRGLGAHLTLIGVTLAVSLGAAQVPSPVHTWAFLMALVCAVSIVLRGVIAEFRTLATHDALTGVLTRGAFLEAADRAVRAAARTARPLSVVVLDLDDFKAVNDTRGHAAGDAVLAGTVDAWGRAIRREDVLGRTGGDEFALLLTSADAVTAAALVERLRAARTPSAWSCGTATLTPGEDLDALLARADAELYADKRRRRTGVPRTVDLGVPTPRPPGDLATRAQHPQDA